MNTPSSSGTNNRSQTQATAVRHHILRGDFKDNECPKNYSSTASRSSLLTKFVHEGSKNEKLRANYVTDEFLKCIICKIVGTNLLYCEGFQNGRQERACVSRFHKDCILKYNDGGFNARYATLPECQNLLLCPLHCCHDCNKSGYKQSAYKGELLECHLCFRSFHKATCLPSGSKVYQVEWNDDQLEKARMIKCPSHPTPKQWKHVEKQFPQAITVCHKCAESNKKYPLVDCKTCPRVFHSRCIPIKKVDEQTIDKERCDFCLENGVIRVNSPVLVKYGHRFYLGLTRPSSLYPKKEEAKLTKIGMSVVQWPLNKNTMSVVPIKNMVQLDKNYLKMAKNLNERNEWKKQIDEFKKREEFPKLYKEVAKEISRSVPYRIQSLPTFSMAIADSDCGCHGNADCSTDDCSYRNIVVECPPTCSSGKRCKNRFVTNGEMHRGIERRATDDRGYGVFATENIKSETNLVEYVGEVIDEVEKNKRLEIINASGDLEASHYNMRMKKVHFYMDSTRAGNIARYLNHSCEPNAEVLEVGVYVPNQSKSKTKLKFEPRILVRTTRPIRKNEEITIDYDMDMVNHVCLCGSSKCSGRMKAGAVQDVEMKKGDDVFNILRKYADKSSPKKTEEKVIPKKRQRQQKLPWTPTKMARLE
ncbi:hypothetical protein CRE_28789 [Caenorhabditis remanei]|uniref:Uncharacterized protein n=1 Tax=Caenorhabditis remanei TaxID=31234 RepID=E3MK20_CAERE|nr:hypothetical protein CRE_28789 [Caenorhabditis remanei]